MDAVARLSRTRMSSPSTTSRAVTHHQGPVCGTLTVTAAPTDDTGADTGDGAGDGTDGTDGDGAPAPEDDGLPTGLIAGAALILAILFGR